MCKYVFIEYPHHGDNLHPTKTQAHEPKDTAKDNSELTTDNVHIVDNDSFILDDDIKLTPPQIPFSEKPATLSLQKDSVPVMDNDIELDLDFSLDDDMELAPPQMPSSQKSPGQPPKKETSVQMDNGLELDLDFSLNHDLESASLSKPSSQSVDTESGLELDMDFSTDSDQGLEIEMEDDSEFDFDFSSENNQNITDTTKKTETMRNTESISPIEFDFDTDEELENDEDMFDVDPADKFDQKAAPQKDSFNKPVPEQKISLNKSKSATQQTSLGGQPIKSSSHGSTLLGNRPNIFEDTSLFEERKKPGKGKLFLVLLFLIILAIAGYAGSIATGIKIPYISDIKLPHMSDIKIPYIDKFLSPKPEPVKLTAEQKTVSGRFITNAISGTLFVITGQVVNHSKIACKDIKIEGTLLATNKLKVKDKTVLCGNIISEDQLLSLDMNAINSILYSSDSNKRFTVEPGRSIPFMIVFSDFPSNLENFTVSVTSYKRIEMDKK
ncbi:MAG: DUF3426 domain-containing protein [Desulfamplus sp.]|nr:DUF3426 domain-containing protein [Desulfamplus sp.]